MTKPITHRCAGSLAAGASIRYEYSKWYLKTYGINMDGDCVELESRTEIKYCPFCGEKLEVPTKEVESVWDDATDEEFFTTSNMVEKILKALDTAIKRAVICDEEDQCSDLRDQQAVSHTKTSQKKLNSENRKNEWYQTPGWIKSGDDISNAIAGDQDRAKMAGAYLDAINTISVQLDRGAFMPVRAHDADAGYDIRTPVKFGLLPGQYSTIDTGVHIAIPKGHVGFLKSKSGLNIKNNIVGEGVIDSGYTGSIKVKLYNFGSRNKMFEVGDKIIQLVILPVYTPKLRQVDKLDDTERGSNGFGSTGR